MTIKPVSKAQTEVLSELGKGARLKYYKDVGRWYCNLPNGMGFLVRKETINVLWRRKLVDQGSAPDYDYVISLCGRALLNEVRSG
jgi:hypothetical protein